MDISKDSWYYRVYRFWLLDKHRGFYKDVFEEDDRINSTDERLQSHLSSTPNLCLFVKVIFIYAPLRYLVNKSGVKLLAKPIERLFKNKFFASLNKWTEERIESLAEKIRVMKNKRLYKWLLINLFVYVIICLELINREFCNVIFEITIALLAIAIWFALSAIVFGIAYGIKKLLNNKYVDTGGFYKEVVKPYAKAKKSKVCPIIGFKE